MNSDVPDFVKNIAQDARYFPALLAILITFMMLLFFDKLTEAFKTWIIPSLVAYAMAASLLGYVQTMIFIRRVERNEEGERILTRGQFYCIVSLHVLLLGAFVAYNFWRGSF
jgi:hypothetical protein